MASSRYNSYLGAKILFREIAKLIRLKIKKNDLDDLSARERYLFKRSIQFLLDSKLIEVRESKEETIVIISEKGKEKAIGFDMEKLEIKKPKKWDKKWRIVIFDIPEEHRNTRNVFQKKLKELGFAKIQKSVYVFPYECQKEIEYIRSTYAIREHVSYFVAVEIDREKQLKKYFNLD